jgi:DNA-binding response OmpR family regulator
VYGIWVSHALQKRGGFELKHVLDARAGLRSVETEPWDLLITDIELPGMAGPDLLDRVRILIPSLPVAVATAHGPGDPIVVAMRRAGVEVLIKPMPVDDFLARVVALIASGRPAGT